MKKITFLLLCALFTAIFSVAAFAADGQMNVSQNTILIAVLVGLGVGLAAAGVTLFLMCRAMSTVRKKGSADGYTRKDSFRLSECRDVFLYSRVSRVRVNTNNNKK